MIDYRTQPSYLEMQIHLTSGAAPARFVQSDSGAVTWLLDQVHPERVFLRRQMLTLSGGGFITAYPCSAIERIDFRSDSLPHWEQHNDIRDVREITSDEFETLALRRDYSIHPDTLYSQIELQSGRLVHLAVRLKPRLEDPLTAADLTLFLSHLFCGPSLLARCDDGVFLLNPANIARFVSRPAPREVPIGAWPARYIRETVVD